MAGLLGVERAAGIVITPACDLANRKVETITYLPILPLRAYPSTAGFLPDLVSESNRLLAAVALPGLSTIANRFPVSPAELAVIEERVRGWKDEKGRSKKELDFADRLFAGLQLLRLTLRPGAQNVPTAALDLLFGVANSQKLLERLVRNSYSLDVHFLPADDQPSEWSAVYEHSVALFRYSITAPVEIFDGAQDLQLGDWAVFLDRLRPSVPAANAFADVRPVKKATLKGPYIADLITRYVSMFIRLGSPDFSAATITEFVAKVRS